MPTTSGEVDEEPVTITHLAKDLGGGTYLESEKKTPHREKDRRGNRKMGEGR